MATTYTPNIKIAYPAIGDLNWGLTENGNAVYLDAQFSPLSGLAVTFHEGQTSSSLLVDIAPGTFVTQDGAVNTYAGITSYSIAASSTKVLYLDGAASWALAAGASYPATAHIRLATVVSGGSALTSITDNRQSFEPSGSWADGLVIVVGTTTGLKIGSATSQKLGFLGATPVIQQAAGADALTAMATFGLKAAEGTPTIAAGAAAGSGPTVSISGTDRRGLATITTGTATTTGTLVTITFSATLASAPKSITLTPANAATATLIADFYASSSNVTTAHFTIDAATAATISTTYLLWYRVDG
jgi:hypothetical protein